MATNTGTSISENLFCVDSTFYITKVVYKFGLARWQSLVGLGAVGAINTFATAAESLYVTHSVFGAAVRITSSTESISACQSSGIAASHTRDWSVDTHARMPP